MAQSERFLRHILQGPTKKELENALFNRPGGKTTPVEFTLARTTDIGFDRKGNVIVTGVQPIGDDGESWNIEGIITPSPADTAHLENYVPKPRRVFIRYSTAASFSGTLKFLT